MERKENKLVLESNKVPLRQSYEQNYQNFTTEFNGDEVMTVDENRPQSGDMVTISFEARLVSGGALDG